MLPQNTPVSVETPPADSRKARPAEKKVTAAPRIASIDALRGVTLAFITGLDGVVLTALACMPDSPAVRAVRTQFHHVAWDGFHAEDLIFPLFVFIAGMMLPVTLGKLRTAGAGSLRAYGLLARRAALLVLLGVLYNTGRVSLEFGELRYGSVLGRIGLAGALAGLVVWHLRPSRWPWVVAGVALGYSALLRFGGDSLERGKNLADKLDAMLMPGRLYQGNHDPEGLVSTLPAAATALAGAWAYHRMKSAATPSRVSVELLLCGGACLALGEASAYIVPINKHLWSGAFVFWTAGWSFLLLALFHAIIDRVGLKAWSAPFTAIGYNSLALYFAHETGLLPFERIGEFLFGWAKSGMSPPVSAALGAGSTFLALVGVAMVLHRRQIRFGI